jgi:hypothetical protein
MCTNVLGMVKGRFVATMKDDAGENMGRKTLALKADVEAKGPTPVLLPVQL